MAFCLATAIFVCLTQTHARPLLTVELESGEVVYSHDETELWHPASITKLMTAQIAFRAIDSGLLTLETPVVLSANASSIPPSKSGLKRGDVLPLKDALIIMLTKSANDLAVAVAETVAGTEDRFAKLMNREARLLGMNGTQFKNASGLHKEGQVTTAQDVAILVRHIVLTYPQYMSFFSQKNYSYKGRNFKNTNGLIGSYQGAIGMKTGYVCSAGYNLVSLASRGGKSFISVVLGEGSSRKREAAAAKLLDDAFRSDTSQFSELRTRLVSQPNLKQPAMNLTKKNCGRGWNGIIEKNSTIKEAVVVPVPAPALAKRPKKWRYYGSLENYSG